VPFKNNYEISLATESPSQKIEGPSLKLRAGHYLNQEQSISLLRPDLRARL